MNQEFPYGIAILLTLIGLVAGILIGYLIFRIKGNKHAFDELAVHDHKWTPVPQPEADANLSAFRHKGAFANLSMHGHGKSSCIIHEPESALEYDNVFFPNFVATHDVKPGYKWSIGLYPEICREKMGGSKVYPRISIFMIPTMRNLDIKGSPKDIIDYFGARNTDNFKYYTPKIMVGKNPEEVKQLTTGITASYIYDQGTIFP